MSNREIPKGLRDLLPAEVKMMRSIEKKAGRLFHSYGYEEVITPTFEYLEVVENGAGGNIRRELFLFMDREGGILSLRPEITVSIARLAATHMQDALFPQRLFYQANVFRHVEPHLAQYREFWQLGVELLGASGVGADSEIITMAVRVLQDIGLDNFKLSLNQIGIFNSLLEDSGMDPEERLLIRSLVESKDLVELARVLEKVAIDDGLKDTIAALPVLHGGLEVLSKIPWAEKNRNAATAVNELLKTYDALKICGVQDKIVLDMGVLRGLDYYTGIVFEGYSPDLGYGLLGGGRYDNLMGKFGFPRPATGFSLGMDRLALVLKNRDSEPQRYLLGGRDFQTLIDKAGKLREEGYVVEMDIEGNSREDLEQIAQARENCILLYLD
jgi:ATP phosphoribosyltransferase regulatory subunit